MLTRDTAESLLDTAESTEDLDVRLPLLTSLTLFGMEESAWRTLGARVVDLLDVPQSAPSRGEHLRLLSGVPLSSARQLILSAASDPNDPDWLLAVRLAGPGPETRQAVALHLPRLLEDNVADPTLLREVACLPLHEYDVPPGPFEPSLTSESVDSRLWAAVALAKVGTLDPLRQVLEGIAADPPEFMYGDPFSAYDTIAMAAPLPPTAHAVVVSWHSDDLNRDQALLVGALTREWDAENQRIVEPDGLDPGAQAEPTEPDQGPVFELLKDAIDTGDLYLLSEAGARAPELSPRDAGALIHDLCIRTIESVSTSEVQAWGNATIDLLGRVGAIDLPVDDLVHRFSEAGDSMAPGQLGAVLARMDHDVVAETVLGEMSEVATDEQERMAELLRSTSWSALTGFAPTLGAGGGAGSILDDFMVGDDAPLAPDIDVPVSLEPAPTVRVTATPDADGATGIAAQPGYQAYPMLKAPGVVVARKPFTVSIGLEEYYDPAIATTGPITIESPAPSFDMEFELVVDPESLAVEGSPRVTLTVTKDDPFPIRDLQLTALTAPRLSDQRTLRLLIRREGRIVGIAKRSLTVVGSPDEMTSARPVRAGRQLLDLEPLLQDAPPDLVVGIYRADEAASNVYVWDVYPLGTTVRLPDSDRRTTIDETAKDLATYMRNQLTSKTFRGERAFLELVGYGRHIQGQMPSAVRQVLLAMTQGGGTPPSVLFMTEEPFVPWELAVLRADYSPAESPFLGARLAMSRWPTDDDDPPPAPRPRLGIEQPGVLTAKYEGVANWPPLPAAEAEAEAFVTANPTTLTIQPRVADVQACLEGTTPVDLLHVALHGQHDPEYGEDGLVLLEPHEGSFTVEFLTALRVRGLHENTATTPFVFLNACQVGAGDNVLGSYAGFAAAVLRTKACGVVAPLWNIDDTVAASLGGRFYKATYDLTTEQGKVPVAEALRQFRAEYTRDAVNADSSGITPTYVAYQFFGHPRFTLQKPGG